MDDKFKFADMFDFSDSDGEPTAQSIAQCLRILAEEAAALGLGRTLAVLNKAIAVCDSEGEDAEAGEDTDADFGLPGHFRPAGSKLH